MIRSLLFLSALFFSNLSPAQLACTSPLPHCGTTSGLIRWTSNGWDRFAHYGPNRPNCEAISGVYSSISLRDCAELAASKRLTCYQVGDVVKSNVDFYGQQCYGCLF